MVVSTSTCPMGDRWFESSSLQRGVRCEPVSRGNLPSYVEKPRFSAGVRGGASGAVGRDVRDAATSGLRAVNISVGSAGTGKPGSPGFRTGPNKPVTPSQLQQQSAPMSWRLSCAGAGYRITDPKR